MNSRIHIETWTPKRRQGEGKILSDDLSHRLLSSPEYSSSRSQGFILTKFVRYTVTYRSNI